jgi:hypothetical protein
MNDALNIWSLFHNIIEVLGIIFIPFIAWVMLTLVNHGKQIIILEEKVNDSLNRRMLSLEDRVVGMESRLESKIDAIEKNVIDCKISINEKASSLNHIIQKIEILLNKVTH